MSSIWGSATGGDAVDRPSFAGTAGAMFPVVLKGLALTVVTLGIYRFWYLTNIRRYLWNNTQAGGDVLEYTGRGVELFIGFLIALAVLVPLYGLLFLAGLVTGPIGAGIVQSLSTVVLLFLAQFALFRARRYRLTRTIWRGVRFQQSGSGFAYAGLSFAWGLLAILTLGLAYPWMRASLERYKMTNTWYGDQKGAFEATGWGLFKRGIWLWALALVVPGALVVIGAAVGEAGGDPANASGAMAAIFGLLLLVLLFLMALIVPIYLAIEYRWWANGCSIGPARASCDLGLFGFFFVYLKYFGVALAFSLALGAVGGVLAFVLKGAGVFDAAPGQAMQIVFGVVTALVYFAVALSFAALWQVFGVRPLWARSFESVEITGLAALTAAQSSEPAANAFGEGVADALDFGGF